ncbi:AfsR/SARP family transcriptional regulator [Streptomyces caeruleatus]|uniref:AfsR/SARP family transcriptional regulator n=1 Tax=Streptomyces caeruleatus TaxID=661399 RepID=UPI00131CFD4A|nr:AfsR/SARP family transcriptional regulator [Streptomyces caeruleatus]
MKVVADDSPLFLTGTHQRTALGLLLLRINRVVTTDRLVTALWRNNPPATAVKMVHKAMAKLRALLAGASSSGTGPELITGEGGYMLRVDPARLDCTRFFALISRSREAYLTGSPVTATRALTEALTLSRGSVLEDLTESGMSWPELRTLEHRRQTVLKDIFDIALSCGRHRDIVADLVSLTEVQIPHERLTGQCMVALYRCGRQLDALAVYRRTRLALVRHLDREPGEDLRNLHLRILNQDASLDWNPDSSLKSAAGAG